MFTVLIYCFSTEQWVWELNTDSECIYDDFYISHYLIVKSHYKINLNEQTHFEIKVSWNDLSLSSGTKRINEKLINIDLIVDVESKSDFGPENRDFERKYLKVSIPIKSHPQWTVRNHMGDL